MYKKAARMVAKSGYTNVMTLNAGIPGWVREGYTLNTEKVLAKTKVPSLKPDQLKAMLGQIFILDIRTESLYKMGWIMGCSKIPLAYLSKRYSEIPKDKKIVVVDHAAKQVLTAARFLNSKGYNNVFRLQGGMMAWMNRGYQLER
ncbi:MAG: rhodanese-like domain-containing protein [Desulfobacterales bacterium]|nr:rhodanese-like domain-containing protein [Desulfobacterales bacterium]